MYPLSGYTQAAADLPMWALDGVLPEGTPISMGGWSDYAGNQIGMAVARDRASGSDLEGLNYVNPLLGGPDGSIRNLYIRIGSGIDKSQVRVVRNISGTDQIQDAANNRFYSFATVHTDSSGNIYVELWDRGGAAFFSFRQYRIQFNESAMNKGPLTYEEIGGVGALDLTPDSGQLFGADGNLPLLAAWPSGPRQLYVTTAQGAVLVSWDIDAVDVGRIQSLADGTLHGPNAAGLPYYQFSLSNGTLAEGVDGAAVADVPYVAVDFLTQPATIDLSGLREVRVWADIVETESGLAIFDAGDTDVAGGLELYGTMTMRFDPSLAFVSRVVDDLQRTWNVTATRLSEDRRFLIADLTRAAAFV
ncbi:MAG: hypothetical protein OXM01_09830 [Gemmatimonadota bacterium]|nr:hypothetical protein [Gemmatimonadota bacterium]